MKKLKVMTIVGTRPEIIRLSRVIPKLDEHCDHVLVHTGQNYDYELNQIFLEDLGLRKPDYFLKAAGKTAADTIAKVISETDKVLRKIRPEALLVLGDTNSCLSVLPAKRLKIPIFHMEAGNRCFDQRVPEEINRRIVDHTADINMPYSSIAREYLLREGLPPDRIIKTGSPMFEVLGYHRKGIESSNVLSKLGLREKSFFLVSAHREENIDSPENFQNLVRILNSLAKKFKVPVIVSTHPRTQNRIDSTQVKFNKKICLLKPLGFKDYVKLQMSARAVLSDSGTINEESSILKFPALNIREAHERPEGMEEAAVMMTGLELDRVFQGLAILKKQDGKAGHNRPIVQDYEVPHVSEKVLRIILSYTTYVRQRVWRMY